MNRVSWLILAKALELLLLVTLSKAYGGAHSLAHLLAMFAAQPELSQIGTITCVLVILGVLAATVNWLVTSVVDWFGLLARRFKRDPGVGD